MAPLETLKDLQKAVETISNRLKTSVPGSAEFNAIAAQLQVVRLRLQHVRRALRDL